MGRGSKLSLLHSGLTPSWSLSTLPLLSLFIPDSFCCYFSPACSSSHCSHLHTDIRPSGPCSSKVPPLILPCALLATALFSLPQQENFWNNCPHMLLSIPTFHLFLYSLGLVFCLQFSKWLFQRTPGPLCCNCNTRFSLHILSEPCHLSSPMAS